MQLPTHEQVRALSKLSNSDMILSIYPMVTNIEVRWIPEIEVLVYRIFVDDPDLTSDNMYKKGLDPHYLVDVHLRGFFNYLGLDKFLKTLWVLFGPDGKRIEMGP